MAPSLHQAPRALPTTRLLKRRRTHRGWVVAVVLTLVVNLGVVVVLSQVSNVVGIPAAAPRAYRITAVEPPPEIIDPVVTQRPEALEAELPEESLPLPKIPLPALDLDPHASGGALSLPELSLGAELSQLPLSVPAFSMPASSAADGVASPEAVGGFGDLVFDQAPELRSAFDLDRYYPRQARMRGVTGSSTLRLEIDADGRVTAVALEASDPPGVFDRAAERLGRSLRFTPAKRGGVDVASRFSVTLKWTLDR